MVVSVNVSGCAQQGACGPTMTTSVSNGSRPNGARERTEVIRVSYDSPSSPW